MREVKRTTAMSLLWTPALHARVVPVGLTKIQFSATLQETIIIDHTDMSEISQPISEQDNGMCNTDSDSCMEEVKSENYVFYVTSSLENSELFTKDIVTNMNYIDMDHLKDTESSMQMEDTTDHDESSCQSSLPRTMTIEENLATSVKSFLERACTETEVNSYRRGQRKKKSAKTKRGKRDYKAWNKPLLKSRKVDAMAEHKIDVGLLLNEALVKDHSTDENHVNRNNEMPQCSYLKNIKTGNIKDSAFPIFKRNKCVANNSTSYTAEDVECNHNINYVNEDFETKRQKKIILESDSALQNEEDHKLVENISQIMNFQALSCCLTNTEPLETQSIAQNNVISQSQLIDDTLDIKEEIIDQVDSMNSLHALTVENRDDDVKKEGCAMLTECKKYQELEWDKENLQLLGIELTEDELDPLDSDTKLIKEGNKIKEESFYPTISDLLNMSGPYRDQMSPEYLYYLHKLAITKSEDERKQVHPEGVKNEKQINQNKAVETAVHPTTNQTSFSSSAIHYPSQMPVLSPVYHGPNRNRGESATPMGRRLVKQFVAPPWPPYPTRAMLHYNDPLGLQHHRKIPFAAKQDSFGTIPFEYTSTSTDMNVGRVPKPRAPVTCGMEAPSSYSPLPGTHPWILKPNPYTWRNYLTATGRYTPASVGSAWPPQWGRVAGRAPMMSPLLTSSINSYINSARTLLSNNTHLLNQYSAGIWDPSGIYSRTNVSLGQMSGHPQSHFAAPPEFGRVQFRGMHPGIFHQYTSSLSNSHPEQAQPHQHPQNRRRKLEEIVDRLKEVEKDN